MEGIIEWLLSSKEPSESKSYLIGLERGRIWAKDHADYFEIREWAELGYDDNIILPSEEDAYLRLLMNESPLEPKAYVYGWLAGVREVLDEYQTL